MGEELEQIEEQYHKELIEKYNALNVAVGKKIVNGKETDIDAIRIYVKKKLPENALLKCNIPIIPKMLNGVKTDVIEVDADFEIGVTTKSTLPFTIQKRIGGGLIGD